MSQKAAKFLAHERNGISAKPILMLRVNKTSFDQGEATWPSRVEANSD